MKRQRSYSSWEWSQVIDLIYIYFFQQLTHLRVQDTSFWCHSCRTQHLRMGKEVSEGYGVNYWRQLPGVFPL